MAAARINDQIAVGGQHGLVPRAPVGSIDAAGRGKTHVITGLETTEMEIIARLQIHRAAGRTTDGTGRVHEQGRGLFDGNRHQVLCQVASTKREIVPGAIQQGDVTRSVGQAQCLDLLGRQRVDRRRATFGIQLLDLLVADGDRRGIIADTTRAGNELDVVSAHIWRGRADRGSAGRAKGIQIEGVTQLVRGPCCVPGQPVIETDLDRLVGGRINPRYRRPRSIDAVPAAGLLAMEEGAVVLPVIADIRAEGGHDAVVQAPDIGLDKADFLRGTDARIIGVELIGRSRQWPVQIHSLALERGTVERVDALCIHRTHGQQLPVTGVIALDQSFGGFDHVVDGMAVGQVQFGPDGLGLLVRQRGAGRQLVGVVDTPLRRLEEHVAGGRSHGLDPQVAIHVVERDVAIGTGPQHTRVGQGRDEHRKCRIRRDGQRVIHAANAARPADERDVAANDIGGHGSHDRIGTRPGMQQITNAANRVVVGQSQQRPGTVDGHVAVHMMAGKRPGGHGCRAEPLRGIARVHVHGNVAAIGVQTEDAAVDTAEHVAGFVVMHDPHLDRCRRAADAAAALGGHGQVMGPDQRILVVLDDAAAIGGVDVRRAMGVGNHAGKVDIRIGIDGDLVLVAGGEMDADGKVGALLDLQRERTGRGIDEAPLRMPVVIIAAFVGGIGAIVAMTIVVTTVVPQPLLVGISHIAGHVHGVIIACDKFGVGVGSIDRSQITGGAIAPMRPDRAAATACPRPVAGAIRTSHLGAGRPRVFLTLERVVGAAVGRLEAVFPVVRIADVGISVGIVVGQLAGRLALLADIPGDPGFSGRLALGPGVEPVHEGDQTQATLPGVDVLHRQRMAGGVVHGDRAESAVDMDAAIAGADDLAVEIGRATTTGVDVVQHDLAVGRIVGGPDELAVGRRGNHRQQGRLLEGDGVEIPQFFGDADRYGPMLLVHPGLQCIGGFQRPRGRRADINRTVDIDVLGGDRELPCRDAAAGRGKVGLQAQRVAEVERKTGDAGCPAAIIAGQHQRQAAGVGTAAPVVVAATHLRVATAVQDDRRVLGIGLAIIAIQIAGGVHRMRDGGRDIVGRTDHGAQMHPQLVGQTSWLHELFLATLGYGRGHQALGIRARAPGLVHVIERDRSVGHVDVLRIGADGADLLQRSGQVGDGDRTAQIVDVVQDDAGDLAQRRIVIGSNDHRGLDVAGSLVNRDACALHLAQAGTAGHQHLAAASGTDVDGRDDVHFTTRIDNRLIRKHQVIRTVVDHAQ